MLPDFATPKHLLLPLRRQTVEVLQALFILLPLLLRQMLKLGIILQGAALLIERLLALLIQPLTKMVTVFRWAICVLRRWHRTELRF